MTSLEADLIPISYLLLVCLSIPIALIYGRTTWLLRKDRSKAYYLAFGICTTWFAKSFYLLWWVIWRAVDKPEAMGDSPVILGFATIIALGAIAHITAAVKAGRPRSIVYVGLLLAWFCTSAVFFFIKLT